MFCVCQIAMETLVCVVAIFVFGTSTVGQAQEVTASGFLDTILQPVVELTIRNTAQSNTPESISSSAIQSTLISRQIAEDHESQTIEATSSSITPFDSVLHTGDAGIVFDSELSKPTSESPSISLVPSFVMETPVLSSFTSVLPTSVPQQTESGLQQSGLTSTMSTNYQNATPAVETETAVNDELLNTALNNSNLQTVLMNSVGNSEVSFGIPEDQLSIVTTPTSWQIVETTTDRDDAFHSSGISPIFFSNNVETPKFQTETAISDRTEHGRSNDVFIPSRRLGFILKNRCTGDSTHLETFRKLHEQIVDLLHTATQPSENQSAFVCDTVYHLTISVGNMTDAAIKETVANMTENFIFGENIRVEKVYLFSDDHSKSTIFSNEEADHAAGIFDHYTLSERELIAYIVAGVSLGTLIFILLTCVCVRFMCKKQSSSLDLCDIPHLNLKLEDFKLTPIPRPTISFSDYGRELYSPSYNAHSPKLENTILSPETLPPGGREYMSFPREMRTFGGKKSSCTRVQSLDVKPSSKTGKGWMSNSREKLNSDFERRSSGFDNVGFRKWF